MVQGKVNGAIESGRRIWRIGPAYALKKVGELNRSKLCTSGIFSAETEVQVGMSPRKKDREVKKAELTDRITNVEGLAMAHE